MTLRFSPTTVEALLLNGILWRRHMFQIVKVGAGVKQTIRVTQGDSEH